MPGETERLGLELFVQGQQQVLKTLQQIDANTAKSAKGMDGMGKSAKSGFGDVAKGVQSIAKSAFFIKQGLIDPVMNATEQMYEFGKSAAQGVAVRDSFDYMAKGVGEASNEMLAGLRKASKGTIADTKLMLAANTAMTLGVANNTEDLAGLLEVSQVRARRFGLTTEQAFSDLTRGIGRLSPMILDNLGFTVDADNTYAAYAKTIGKASDALTDLEKRHALVNRILQDTKAEVEAANSATESYINTFERWDATSENFKQSMGEAILPTLSLGIESWMGMGEQVAETSRLLEVWAFAAGRAAVTGGDTVKMAKKLVEGLDSTATSATYGTANMGDFRTALDEVKTAAENATTAIKGLQTATEFTGTTGTDAINNQKDAYAELLKLPEQRAAAEQQWNGIIMQIAKTSTDARIQSALSALNTENTNFEGALAKRKADIETHNAWVKSEEERIAQLRTEGKWKEAGEAEQILNHAKIGFQNDLVSREDLQKEHDDRMKGLNNTLWSAIKNSRDQDLLLAIAHKDSELGLLDDRKKALEEYIRTGKKWSDDWRGSWATAMDKFKENGIDKFDGFYDHVKKKLDAPVTFEVKGVYVGTDVSGGNPVGGEAEGLQHGGIFSRPTRAVIGEAGPEAVLPLTDPGRMARILAQAMSMRGVGSSYTHAPTYSLTTQAVTRPGGLRMEFGAMAAADELASR